MNTDDLINIFNNQNFNTKQLSELIVLNLHSLKFPTLPVILLENENITCLDYYLNNFNNDENNYLIINFLSNNLYKLPPTILNSYSKYIDNCLAISIDKGNYDDFLNLNNCEKYINNQCILCIIKIYETNQLHLLEKENFDKIKDKIVSKICETRSTHHFDSISNFSHLKPLFIDIAEHSTDLDFLLKLDKVIKEHLPYYMENYIDKMLLKTKLNCDLNENNKKIQKRKI